MVYLLNDSYLPWCNFSKMGKKMEFKQMLKERLSIRYTKDIFKLVPRNLRNIFKRVFTLQFEEEPPYDSIIAQIAKEIRSNVKLDSNMQPITHKFEWTKTLPSMLQDRIMNSENRSYKRLNASQSSKLAESASSYLVKAMSQDLGKEPVVGAPGSDDQEMESRNMRLHMQNSLHSVLSNMSSVVSNLSPNSHQIVHQPSRDNVLNLSD